MIFLKVDISNPLPFSLNPFHYAREGLNYFNPFIWLNDKIHDLFLDLGKVFERLVFKVPHTTDFSWIYRVVGEEIGLTNVFAVAAVMYCFMLAALFAKRRALALYSFVYAAALVSLAPFWLGFCIYLISIGDTLAIAASHWYIPAHSHGTQAPLLALPGLTIVNVLGAIIGFSWILQLGTLLVLILSFYWVINITIAVTGLIAFAFLFVGRTPKKICDWYLSFALAGMVLARPVAILAVEMARWSVDTWPLGGTSFMATVYFSQFLALGILALVGLPILIHNYVPQVTGNIVSAVKNELRATARSTVSGEVFTRQRDPWSVRTLRFYRSYNTRMNQRFPDEYEPTRPDRARVVGSVALAMAGARLAGSSVAGVGWITAGQEILNLRAERIERRERARRRLAQEQSEQEGSSDE